MTVSFEKLNEAFADATEEDVAVYYEAFLKVTEKYEINTPQRMASFIAQLAHESMNLRATKENLNYSQQGLLKVFPKYFNSSTAAAYHRQPERIANRVYANRMGNGNEASGEGWKYRGRGLIQLTGKDNHGRFAEDMGMSIDDSLSYLDTPEGAMMSAGWFWDKNKLNAFADKGDIKGQTKRINGGFNGLQERLENYEHALETLQG